MFVRDEPLHSMPEEEAQGSGQCFWIIHREGGGELRFYWNMSGEKATSPCNKFQANIFNKSKCQNCFKSRELHLLNDHDKEQVTITATRTLLM